MDAMGTKMLELGLIGCCRARGARCAAAASGRGLGTNDAEADWPDGGADHRARVLVAVWTDAVDGEDSIADLETGRVGEQARFESFDVHYLVVVRRRVEDEAEPRGCGERAGAPRATRTATSASRRSLRASTW